MNHFRAVSLLAFAVGLMILTCVLAAYDSDCCSSDLNRIAWFHSVVTGIVTMKDCHSLSYG